MPDARAFVVEADADGVRLDVFLAQRLPALSRARSQAVIAGAGASVDGRPARPSQRLKAGAAVSVVLPDPEPAQPAPEDIPLRVLHEDAHLLVVDKPAGLVVHPGAGAASGTLVNALLHRVRDLSGIGGVLRPGIVHRLDKGTSGLILVAKDDATHRALARQFAQRTVRKDYQAVVLGVPARAQGEIDRPIGRDPVHRRRLSVDPPRARTARTSYVTRERLDGAALLDVRIHTGRTHQIRVHLASIGHPVAGDALYGGTRAPSTRSPRARAALGDLARPALHAARLEFDHPATGERIRASSPLPPDLAALVEALRP
jgi:23S rRNA pseudouridine1911/1915/1917 synthase